MTKAKILKNVEHDVCTDFKNSSCVMKNVLTFWVRRFSMNMYMVVENRDLLYLKILK